MNNSRRPSIQGAGMTSGYKSPDFPKPRTPYEDKVVPTLRNRNRSDAGHASASLLASMDIAGTNNEDAESIQGGPTLTSNEDATAELNQAEMIEANQMMAVFDKQLVSCHMNVC
jgi:hypothetical protein